MQYRYAGPNPAEDPDGELVHPGDVRDFDDEPDCPPWRSLDPEPDPPPPPATTPAITPATGAEGGM